MYGCHYNNVFLLNAILGSISTTSVIMAYFNARPLHLSSHAGSLVLGHRCLTSIRIKAHGYAIPRHPSPLIESSVCSIPPSRFGISNMRYLSSYRSSDERVFEPNDEGRNGRVARNNGSNPNDRDTRKAYVPTGSGDRDRRLSNSEIKRRHYANLNNKNTNAIDGRTDRYPSRSGHRFPRDSPPLPELAEPAYGHYDGDHLYGIQPVLAALRVAAAAHRHRISHASRSSSSNSDNTDGSNSASRSSSSSRRNTAPTSSSSCGNRVVSELIVQEGMDAENKKACIYLYIQST
jgi:hypothetical protein